MILICTCSVREGYIMLGNVVAKRNTQSALSFLASKPGIRLLSTDKPERKKARVAGEELPKLYKNYLTPQDVFIQDVPYLRDNWTNVTDRILSFVGRNLHLQKYHPLTHIKTRISDFMYKTFPGRSKRTPRFTVFDNISPVVTVEQNFDSLLVPLNHVSRGKSDSYYLNCNNLLRAHTTAHQVELVRQGMNNFIIVGDVYRRDEIDKSHYPVFHQVDAVSISGIHELFQDDKLAKELSIFEKGVETAVKQDCHTVDAVMVMTQSLQSTLILLVKHLFGNEVETRWVDSYFPFTHPSWELEVKFNGEWMELLGCGIMRQTILDNAGASEKIGWAFGLGLERLAMKLYQIPDIRLFWSVDPGFLHQFKVEDSTSTIVYKPVSIYPSCSNDISFWLPEDNSFTSADFYDLVRSIAGDMVEQVSLVDEFHHLKKQRWSHCYRIVYRHMEKTLTQSEANKLHNKIEEVAKKRLRVMIR